MIWVVVALAAGGVIVVCADRFIASMNPLDVESEDADG